MSEANDGSVTEYKVIGTQPIALDAIDKATGRAAYGIDIKLPGMIHGKMLRSPYAHARILSIDVNRALALPGVLAVVTWKDLWTAEEIACPEKVTPGRKHFRDNYL